jgi:hypothetical protein
MRFIPYDNGTYLVRSRTRTGHHIVDVNEMTCSCEGYEFNQTCDHLRTAMRRFKQVKYALRIVTVRLIDFLP